MLLDQEGLTVVVIGVGGFVVKGRGGCGFFEAAAGGVLVLGDVAFGINAVEGLRDLDDATDFIVVDGPATRIDVLLIVSTSYEDNEQNWI
ncbi:hypothetical protein ACFL6U_25240 [Planctomycetota bacterium]